MEEKSPKVGEKTWTKSIESLKINTGNLKVATTALSKSADFNHQKNQCGRLNLPQHISTSVHLPLRNPGNNKKHITNTVWTVWWLGDSVWWLGDWELVIFFHWKRSGPTYHESRLFTPQGKVVKIHPILYLRSIAGKFIQIASHHNMYHLWVSPPSRFVIRAWPVCEQCDPFNEPTQLS